RAGDQSATAAQTEGCAEAQACRAAAGAAESGNPAARSGCGTAGAAGGDRALGQCRLPAEPGAGVPGPGAAPWLAGHRPAARSGTAQRPARRDPDPEQQRPRPARPGGAACREALALRTRQAWRSGGRWLGLGAPGLPTQLTLNAFSISRGLTT